MALMVQPIAALETSQRRNLQIGTDYCFNKIEIGTTLTSQLNITQKFFRKTNISPVGYLVRNMILITMKIIASVSKNAETEFVFIIVILKIMKSI